MERDRGRDRDRQLGRHPSRCGRALAEAIGGGDWRRRGFRVEFGRFEGSKYSNSSSGGWLVGWVGGWLGGVRAPLPPLRWRSLCCTGKNSPPVPRVRVWGGKGEGDRTSGGGGGEGVRGSLGGTAERSLPVPVGSSRVLYTSRCGRGGVRNSAGARGRERAAGGRRRQTGGGEGVSLPFPSVCVSLSLSGLGGSGVPMTVGRKGGRGGEGIPCPSPGGAVRGPSLPAVGPGFESIFKPASMCDLRERG